MCYLFVTNGGRKIRGRQEKSVKTGENLLEPQKVGENPFRGFTSDTAPGLPGSYCEGCRLRRPPRRRSAPGSATWGRRGAPAMGGRCVSRIFSYCLKEAVSGSGLFHGAHYSDVEINQTPLPERRCTKGNPERSLLSDFKVTSMCRLSDLLVGSPFSDPPLWGTVKKHVTCVQALWLLISTLT